MLKSLLASLAVATALLTASAATPHLSSQAEAGSLRKALIIGGTVVASGLVIRCGVRVAKGRSCL